MQATVHWLKGCDDRCLVRSLDGGVCVCTVRAQVLWCCDVITLHISVNKYKETKMNILFSKFNTVVEFLLLCVCVCNLVLKIQSWALE